MKYAAIFACGCAALLSVSAFAEGVDDALITFSTQGPDKYADGTVVKDGENYALVWVKKDAAFGGFTAEGKLVDEENNMLLGVFPRAKDGRCQDTFVQISKTFADTYGAAGGFVLYLLDTRSADKTAVAATKDDLAKGVQSYGEVAALGVSSGSIKVTTATEAGEAAIASAIPSGILPPVIKSAEVKDGMFVVTVEQTSPAIRYNLSGGETPSADEKAGIAEAAKAGDAKQTIELKYPIKDGENVKFFKVTRDPISK